MNITELNTKLNEMMNTKKILYHGGPIKFNKIIPKYMFTKNSNAQEGVGIYFTPYLEVANKYGDHIMFIVINENKKFIDSYELASDAYKLYDIEKLIDIIKIQNKDELYVYITNWKEVDYDLSTDKMKEEFKSILPHMMEEEVRNFHIEMVEIFGVENFIFAWNKIFGNKYYGTYNPELEFYAVMNTKVKVNILK